MSSISALKAEFEAVHAAAYADGKTDAELEESEARRSELFGLLLEEGWAAQAPPKSSTVSFVEIPAGEHCRPHDDIMGLWVCAFCVLKWLIRRGDASAARQDTDPDPHQAKSRYVIEN